MGGVKTNRFPLLAPSPRHAGDELVLIGVRIMACPGVRLEGWGLRWFAHTLGGGVGRGGGIGSTCFHSWLFQSGWVFQSLVSFVPEWS